MIGSHGARRAPLALGVALVLLALVPSAESHPFHEGSGCGRWYRRWRTAHECSFPFHGFPISVYGNATSKTSANVHVWVTSSLAPDVALVECTRTDSRWVTCDNIRPEMDYLLDVQREDITLTCHVRGRTRGQYWCASGGGAPVPP